MRQLFTTLFLMLSLSLMAQLPTIHPGTVTIGTVPAASATDSILTVNSAGLIGHIPKSEVESQFIKVNSGFGEGLRYRDYPTNRFRSIGLGTLDLTQINGSSPAGNDYGARANYGLAIGLDHKIGTGDHHISLGVGNTVTGTYNNMAFGAANSTAGFVSNFTIGAFNTVIQGYGSGAIGSYNTVNQDVNGFGVAIGHNNNLTDIASNAVGTSLISKSRYTVAVGVANTDYAESGNNAARPIFVVGTGTTNTGSGAWTANLRRDGFIVRHNGLVEAPDLTTAKIDAGVARTLVTKEWVTANAGGSVPTLEEVLEETDAQGSSAGFWPIEMKGGDLTFATYGNIPLGGLISQGYEYQLNLGTDNTVHRSILSPNFFSLKNGNNVEARLRVDNSLTSPPGIIELTMPHADGVLATEEWVTSNTPVPNLQQVLSEGSVAEIDSVLINTPLVEDLDQYYINEGPGYKEEERFFSNSSMQLGDGQFLKKLDVYNYFYEQDNVVVTDNNTYQTKSINISPNGFLYRNESLEVSMENDTTYTYQDISLNYSAINRLSVNPDGVPTSQYFNWPSVSGQLALTSQLDFGLQAVNQGNGIGYIIKGRNENNYGNVGLRAVDMSYQTSASSTRGATANDSFAIGINTTASVDGAFAGGLEAHADAPYATALGIRAISSGWGSFSAGADTYAPSWAETSVGSYPTTYTPGSTSARNFNDRAFTVGIGVTSANADAFTILKGGEVGIGIDNFEANHTDDILQVNGDISTKAVKIESFLLLHPSMKPSSPVDGTIIRDSNDNNRMKIYIGSAWYIFDLTVE